jgi:cytidylate kinase
LALRSIENLIPNYAIGRRKSLGITITISGLHGTGKTTYAAALADYFDLRHVSSGTIFRSVAKERNLSLETLSREAENDPELDRLIDAVTKTEANKGSVVIDGLLTAWMTLNLDTVKIFLTAPERIRMERISKRDNLSFSEARRVTLLREESEKSRFKRYYNFDLDDYSIYDLVINTSLLSVNSNLKVLKTLIKECLNTKNRRM